MFVKKNLQLFEVKNLRFFINLTITLNPIYKNNSKIGRYYFAVIFSDYSIEKMKSLCIS